MMAPAGIELAFQADVVVIQPPTFPVDVGSKVFFVSLQVGLRVT